MHEMSISHEKCLGAYCGRTVDESGNFSSCGVSHLIMVFILRCYNFVSLSFLSMFFLDFHNFTSPVEMSNLEYCLITHTHTFNDPLSVTTWVIRYQKDKTNLDFTEARDSVWQWHQLQGHMQFCTLLQYNTIQYNTKFVKRHVAVASEALANRSVRKQRRRRTNVL